MNFKTRLYFY